MKKYEEPNNKEGGHSICKCFYYSNYKFDGKYKF